MDEVSSFSSTKFVFALKSKRSFKISSLSFKIANSKAVIPLSFFAFISTPATIKFFIVFNKTLLFSTLFPNLALEDEK